MCLVVTCSFQQICKQVILIPRALTAFKLHPLTKSIVESGDENANRSFSSSEPSQLLWFTHWIVGSGEENGKQVSQVDGHRLRKYSGSELCGKQWRRWRRTEDIFLDSGPQQEARANSTSDNRCWYAVQCLFTFIDTEENICYGEYLLLHMEALILTSSLTICISTKKVPPQRKYVFLWNRTGTGWMYFLSGCIINWMKTWSGPNM